MEISRGLPKSFFEKSRPEAPKNSLKNIIPFKFTNDEKVKSGKYKDKVLITTTKKRG